MEPLLHDQQLLTRMAVDDKAAFSEIYVKYWEELFDAAYKRLKNTNQSEDIVQDLFVKLWIKRVSLKIGNLSAYLHTAVKYAVYNYVQRDLVAESFYEPFETISEFATVHDTSILKEEIVLLIDSYIKTLPKNRKKVFILYFREEYDIQQIAAEMGISPKTVQNHISIALRGLRSTKISFIILYFLSS